MNVTHYLKLSVEKLEELIASFSGGGLGTDLESLAGTAVSVGVGDSNPGTLRVVNASNDLNLSAINISADIIADCVDQVNNHLEVDTNAINGVLMSVNSGDKDNGCQRICIATNDVPIALVNTNLGTINTSIGTGNSSLSTVNTNLTSIINQGVEPRINTNYRYKWAGGTSPTIYVTDWSPCAYNGVDNLDIGDISPPISQMYIHSSSANDDNGGSGALSVRLIYIDSAGALQIANVNTDGTAHVNIGTNVREIVDFYCLSFGATGSNEGIIYLRNTHDDKFSSWIKVGFNNYTSIGIDIPENGKTYLKQLSMASLEINNINTHIAISLILIERTATTYTYRILWENSCTYFQNKTIDLSFFPPISGSGDSAINYTIYPMAKSLGAFDTYCAINLTAINEP